MSDNNLFNSVVRFVREYNYSDSLFSKSFLEYISKHYKDCFSKERIVVSEEEKAPQNSSIKADSEKASKNNPVAVPKPKECSNKELIEAYNRLNDLFFSLSPRLLNSILFDLHREFLSRFNKTPFELSMISEETYKISWNRKLLYLKYVEDFIFIDENTTKQAPPPVVLTQFPKQTSLTHVYISRTGDKQTIAEFRESLKKYPNNEIVDKYNKIERLYGAHQQALYIIALNQEFILRFGKTPFQIDENCLVGLGRKILYISNIDSFVFVDEN